MIATMTDAQAIGYCTRGVRRWFAGRAVTFEAFLAAGVSVDWLRAQGDAMADRLADYVEQQATAGADVGTFEGQIRVRTLICGGGDDGR